MIDLNNLEQIKKLDPKDVYGSTGMFVSQCEQIWQDSKNINVQGDLSGVKNIVLCGMGGSAYGGYVVQALFKDRLSVPLISNNDYTLPAFVNEKTLVVLSSYSGSTKESLTAGEEAKEKGAKIAGITNGGKLGAFLTENNYPRLIFDAKFNPSGQPRLATGYMVLGFIALLDKLGVQPLTDEEVTTAVKEVQNAQEEIKTQAQEIAKKLVGYIPVIFSAEFLGGNAHIMRNQFNETAKSFAAYAELPELNHHLMEGLKNPEGHKLEVLFINSNLYSEKINKRNTLTKDVVGKNNVPFVEYSPAGTSKLAQSLNLLSFGGYVTLYLGLLYGLDPSLIPWVDWFKQELSK